VFYSHYHAGRRAVSTAGGAAFRGRLAGVLRIWPRRSAVKVVVDFDLCEANALCMQVAPEVFKVDDNDMLEILIERPPEKYRKQIEEAVRLCPRQAISITED
jgi:ferredoxin